MHISKGYNSIKRALFGIFKAACIRANVFLAETSMQISKFWCNNCSTVQKMIVLRMENIIYLLFIQIERGDSCKESCYNAE